MTRLLVRFVLTAATLALAAALVPGIELRGPGTTLVAALAFGLVNAVVRPVLIVLTFPLTVLTLGLFILVLNALCLWLASALVPGFEIRGFGAAFLGAAVISAVSWLVNAVVR